MAEDLKDMVTLGCRWAASPQWQEVRQKKNVQAAALEVLEEFMSSWKSGPVDESELKLGIETEQEHTGNALLAEKIARDHLAESPTYYSTLTGAGL